MSSETKDALIGAGVLLVIALIAKSIISGALKSQQDKAIEEDLKKNSQKPTYNETTYSNFADRIQQAEGGLLDDKEEEIYSVFRQIKNDKDFLFLSKAFGERRIMFSFKWAGLSGFLASFLNKKEIQNINNILKSNGVKSRV